MTIRRLRGRTGGSGSRAPTSGRGSIPIPAGGPSVTASSVIVTRQMIVSCGTLTEPIGPRVSGPL